MTDIIHNDVCIYIKKNTNTLIEYRYSARIYTAYNTKPSHVFHVQKWNNTFNNMMPTYKWCRYVLNQRIKRFIIIMTWRYEKKISRFHIIHIIIMLLLYSYELML